MWENNTLAQFWHPLFFPGLGRVVFHPNGVGYVCLRVSTYVSLAVFKGRQSGGEHPKEKGAPRWLRAPPVKSKLNSPRSESDRGELQLGFARGCFQNNGVTEMKTEVKHGCGGH